MFILIVFRFCFLKTFIFYFPQVVIPILVGLDLLGLLVQEEASDASRIAWSHFIVLPRGRALTDNLHLAGS